MTQSGIYQARDLRAALYGRLRIKQRTRTRLLHLPKLRKPDDLFNRSGCERQADLRLCEVPSPVRRRNARKSLSGTTRAGLSYPAPAVQLSVALGSLCYWLGFLLEIADENCLPRQAWRERNERRQHHVREVCEANCARTRASEVYCAALCSPPHRSHHFKWFSEGG